jgi:hypothetical protein
MQLHDLDKEPRHRSRSGRRWPTPPCVSRYMVNTINGLAKGMTGTKDTTV